MKSNLMLWEFSWFNCSYQSFWLKVLVNIEKGSFFKNEDYQKNALAPTYLWSHLVLVNFLTFVILQSGLAIVPYKEGLNGAEMFTFDCCHFSSTLYQIIHLQDYWDEVFKTHGFWTVQIRLFNFAKVFCT